MLTWKKPSESKTKKDFMRLLDVDALPKYQVVLFNDDYTPMEFVVNILRAVFQLSETEAIDLTHHVHRHGKGVCGIYPEVEAKAKAMDVMSLARDDGHPLLCLAEPIPK